VICRATGSQQAWACPELSDVVLLSVFKGNAHDGAVEQSRMQHRDVDDDILYGADDGHISVRMGTASFFP
jgi:hypothetical protein